MVAPSLAAVLSALLAVSVPVHGKCFKKPDANGHVNWPKQKTAIGKNLFRKCLKLKTINLPPEVEFVDDAAFFRSGLNLVELTTTWREKAEEQAKRTAKCAERTAKLNEQVSERDTQILALEEKIDALERRCRMAAPSTSPTLSPSAPPVTEQPTSSTLCEFSEEKKDVYLPDTIEKFPSLQDAKNACDSDMNCGGVTLYLSNYETRHGGAGPCLLQSGAGASSWVCGRSRPPRPQARPGQGPDVPDSETCWSWTRDITTVAPEEWEYFLGFQESRRKGFSSPCGDKWTGVPTCNDPKAGKNHWPPNPVKVVFDCKMWVAAYRHAEDQAIQGYFSHSGENPVTSERERSERVGAQSRGEHQVGRDTSASGALNGLQASPGHSNSMMQPKYKGMAVAHGKPGQRGIWTVLYNFGGEMIVDSESCIPEGYTATGDRK